MRLSSFRRFSPILIPGCTLLTAGLLLLSTYTYAQSAAATGRLEGAVTDPSGASVPDADITIRNQNTGVSSTVRSNGEGEFTALYLDPGTYEVSIQKAGFGKLVLQDIIITVGTRAIIHPQLTVGKIDTTVNVGAGLPLVDTAASSLGTVVDQSSIQSLPTNGRNFTDFALLTAGATTDGDFGMISFNGVSGNFNNYTVDGGNNNNAFFSQQIGRTSIPYQFSEDVIREFQVTSTGFEAEFGQAGGGVVNTVTKSGTNQVHGDGYYYILDSATNANDEINQQAGIAKPHDRRQQFGGTVGGPLIHDRLFYLANYEGQVRNEPLTVNDSSQLNDALTQDPNFLADNPALAAQIAAAAGSFPRSFNQNAVFGKINGVLNDKNSFNVTYNFQRFRSPHGYFNTPTSTGDGLSLTDGATSQFFQASLQTAFNATTINEFRFHFGSDYHFDLPATPPTSPAVTIQNPDTGFVFGGNRFQLANTDRRYEFTDNFTKIVGKHTLKTGVDINISRNSDSFTYGPKGEYRFANLNDVVTGTFELYLQSFGQSTINQTSPTYSFFGQDEFRATPRLTLNYGLRYDLQVLPQPKQCNPGFALTCHIPYSKNNVAPRVGFAYALDRKGGTVVRGSFGLFYIQEDLLDVSEAFASNGVTRPFLVVVGPKFGNSNPLVTYPDSLTSFPSGAGGTPSIVVFSPTFRSPYVEQGSLAVEHQFGTQTALSVGYAYSHGLRLLGNSNGVTRQANGNFGFDLNLVPPDQQPAFSQGTAFATATVTLPTGKTYTTPDFSAIDGFLDPNFGPINAIDNSGLSIYHGLLVSLRHHSRQFFSSVAYTLSHATDQGTGYFNQFDQASQRGPSQLDQTHRFVTTGVWSPQFHALKGFEFSGIVTLASGRPYTAVFDNPEVNFSIVPGEKFNSFRGPTFKDVDFSVARTFHLGERYQWSIRAEGFDLFNHPNYQQNVVDNVQYTLGDPATDPNNSTNGIWTASPNSSFGKPGAIVPKFGARSFQFSTRFSF
ncbi:MAG: TonB-dependent receptor, plug [Candidatus Sulfotelmatobacter sp.]|nr:TonB-dependent receptor, plug [Candidatus Sulfotelmatobacter sp.]